MRRSVLKIIVSAAALAILANVPRPAHALESVEGTTLGDMGYYWTFPQESWIFPHRISNIDNRAMIQYAGSGAQNTLSWDNIMTGTISNAVYNALPVQVENGAGASIGIIDNLNLALWLSSYGGPGINSFLNRGVTAMQWTHAQSTGPDALAPIDMHDVNNGDTLDAGRKVDLFMGYAMPDSGIEAGFRFWWGADNQSLTLDDSEGAISINEASDPANGPTAWDNQDVKESKYALREWGFGLGGGFSGIEGMRVDAGLDLNFIGVTWEPNGITDYVDAGGTGIGLNLRGHYAMTDTISVGAFVRYARDSFGMEPKRQRDGGDLDGFIDTEDPATPDPSPVPPAGDPNTVNPEVPVDGIKYEETKSELQVAGLVKYAPMSRVTLYGALGVARVGASQKTSIGEDWFAEQSASLWATPFINLGFVGKITDNLDLFMGASRRMQQWTTKDHYFDSRIPDDGNQGASGAPPATPDDHYTNASRRDFENKYSTDVSPLELSLGGRFMMGGFQWVMSVSENLFFNGPYFLTGASSGAPIFWFSLNYDWDFDTDQAGGNGTITQSGAAPKAPATKSGGEEVFDS